MFTFRLKNRSKFVPEQPLAHSELCEHSALCVCETSPRRLGSTARLPIGCAALASPLATCPPRAPVPRAPCPSLPCPAQWPCPALPLLLSAARNHHLCKSARPCGASHSDTVIAIDPPTPRHAPPRPAPPRLTSSHRTPLYSSPLRASASPSPARVAHQAGLRCPLHFPVPLCLSGVRVFYCLLEARLAVVLPV